MAINKTKKCKVCKKAFFRNPKYSDLQWNNKKMCSYTCSGIETGKRTKGRSLTERHKKAISNSNKGKRPYQMTDEIRDKISKTVILRMSERLSELKKGSKNPQWKGGISNSGYSVDWTRTLRRAIRERDLYTCQECLDEQGDVSLDVHHIDYDKHNCSPDNLISLCRRCHVKTNSKREYWQDYFNNKSK